MTVRSPVIIIVVVYVLLLGTSGCHMGSKGQILRADKSQVELRSFQTRAFATTDKRDD